MCLKGFKKYCHSENVGNLSREMEPNENCGIKMQYSKWKMYWVCLTTDPEKAMALQSNILAWKILWMEEPGRLQSMGSLRVRHNWATSLSLSCIGEGNGNPLQCSCLENPRDGGAWWSAVYGVTQSRTRLKWLSSSSSRMMSASQSD